MAFQPCPGIASGTIQVTDSEGDIAENVLHFYKGSGVAWTATELTELADAIDTWITTGDGSGNTYLTPMTNTSTVTAIVCRSLTTAADPEITKTVSHAGLETGAALPSGITKAFTLRTGLAGRSQRGRVFLVRLGVNVQSTSDTNNASAGVLTLGVAAFGALITAIPAANAAWTWVVLSRYNNNTKRSSGVGTPISSVGYSHIALDFQRRRAPSHARHH